MVVAVSVAIGLVALRRHKSRYDYLYSLNPVVGTYVPSGPVALTMSRTGLTYRMVSVRGPRGVRRYYVASVPATPPSRETAMAFRPDQVDAVADRLRRNVKGLAFAVGTEDRIVMYGNGVERITFCTGSYADSIAGAAHIALPRGGCVVTVGEPPDWFTERLNAALHFLHVR